MESLIFPLLIALLAVPLFLQARKQKKLTQEQQKLQKSLSTGDRVMTTSGLFGTVVGTADDTVDLEISPGVTTTWVRAAVREKVNTEEAEASEALTETGEPTEASEALTETGEPAKASETLTETGEPAKAEKAESEQTEQTESSAQVAEPSEKQKTN